MLFPTLKECFAHHSNNALLTTQIMLLPPLKECFSYCLKNAFFYRLKNAFPTLQRMLFPHRLKNALLTVDPKSSLRGSHPGPVRRSHLHIAFVPELTPEQHQAVPVPDLPKFVQIRVEDLSAVLVPRDVRGRCSHHVDHEFHLRSQVDSKFSFLQRSLIKLISETKLLLKRFKASESKFLTKCTILVEV